MELVFDSQSKGWETTISFYLMSFISQLYCQIQIVSFMGDGLQCLYLPLLITWYMNDLIN